jgi:hypothetical protein
MTDTAETADADLLEFDLTNRALYQDGGKAGS